MDKVFQSLPLHKLHCVEIAVPCSTKVQYRGNVRVTKAGRGASFAQEMMLGRLVSEISFADDLQRHVASQIDIECLVSHSHGSMSQLDGLPVFPGHELIMLQALRYGFGWRFRRLVRNRFAWLSAGFESFAEHANRTVIQCSRELTAENL